MIASLRLVAVSSENKKVIPANMWGKTKTVTQMIAIIYGIAVMYFNESILPLIEKAVAVPDVVGTVIMILFDIVLWVSTIFAVISGVIYTKESYEFIDPSK